MKASNLLFKAFLVVGFIILVTIVTILVYYFMFYFVFAEYVGNFQGCNVKLFLSIMTRITCEIWIEDVESFLRTSVCNTWKFECWHY